jgi:hypothetical protein
MGDDESAGSVAGRPDDSTHPNTPRNVETSQPAAVFGPWWQAAQRACRIEATSESKTGVCRGTARSCEHDASAHAVARARRDRRINDGYYGRPLGNVGGGLPTTAL